jgi:putative ABC transport system permease protein
MKHLSLLFRSALYYWKSHVGLLFGAFLATAILSGSLVVGDSVRASLSRAAAQRLGKVTSGLLGGDRWFTEELAKKNDAAPVIILTGAVSAASSSARVNAAQVMGVEDAFWKQSPSGKVTSPSAAGSTEEPGIALNEVLARKLDAKIGDTVLVRMEKPSAISRDAPLSGEANQDVTLRRKVSAIIGAQDFGAFQLHASQLPSATAFLALSDLQTALTKKGRINAMLSSITSPPADCAVCVSAPITPASGEGKDRTLSIEDFALKLARVKGSVEEWEITTDRVFLDESLATKLLASLPKSYGVLTYLVNGLSSAKGATPYSMVAGVPLSGRTSALGPQAPGSAAISQWLAEDQQLAVGDELTIHYFTVGIGRDLQEKTASFKVSRILPMADADLNPTWAPEFPGVTDAPNCRDWQPGIPVKTDKIRDKDEAYWKQYKTTPKAFINIEDGQKLWENRFGKYTAIRFAVTDKTEADLRREIASMLKLSDIGLVPRDFKTEAAAAAEGSVDFGGLFVGLSMFLIAAALVFAALLFLFTLEKRVSQIGVLLAIGWTPRAVRWTVLGEAGLVAFFGTVLGIFGGILYTKLAIAGLNGVWGGATVGLQLVYEARPLTLLIAFDCSILASIGTLWLASRRIFKARAKDLLVGEVVIAPAKTGASKSRIAGALGMMWQRFGLPVLLLSAAVMPYFGAQAKNPEEIAGMFFGSGFCLLGAGLILIHRRLKAADGQRESAPITNSLGGIGLRNVTRRPGRSLSVIGMMAGGIFLVIAVNAFRLSGDADPTARDSGTGGFALIGESTLPIYEDLNSEAAWDAFALDDKIMKQAKVVPFRVREGDDASCLNLNKAQNPVLTAVNPKLLAARKAFTFVDGSWDDLGDHKSQISDLKSAIPAIADQATAMWGLGKGVGDTLTYKDSHGQEFQVKLVGLLAGSVLQGKLIISEQDFLAKYPDAAGYKFFLIDAAATKEPPANIQHQESSIKNPASITQSHLTKQLETRGLALETTTSRLEAFSAVQNTYIGIFTVLGGLGVLLGTAGLGVLAARNVLERRGEFGLMQALGFLPAALRRMVLSEHVALLVTGLLLGLISAAIAVWPNVSQSGGALPWSFLLWLNLGILAFGIIVCWLAARVALSGKLLEAVRKE